MLCSWSGFFGGSGTGYDGIIRERVDPQLRGAMGCTR